MSQLVHAAAKTLEGRFSDIWVEGEVSGLSRPASGHLYFNLKDDKCSLPVVMWKGSARRLRFRMEQGLQLRCRGHLGIYERSGKFQFYARTAEPAGLGELQLAFEQLKAKLGAEGLFDEARKKPLPRLPRTVAVVTSASGAALQDILRVLRARFPLRVVVSPTRVQGEGAAGEIAGALERADSLGADLIIVGRGGGSLEDLWAFNEEVVARAIAACQTPVISAVGHEVDVTIADFVADRRAATPSNAAEMAVPEKAELQQKLEVARRRLDRAARNRIHRASLQLSRLRERLERPDRLIGLGRQRLDEQTARLQAALTRALTTRRRELAGLSERLTRQEPRIRLGRLAAELSIMRTRAAQAMRRKLDEEQRRLAERAAQLHALSPLAVLARGYSLVFDGEGGLLKEAAAVSPGDPIRVRLHKGELEATTTGVHEDEGEER